MNGVKLSLATDGQSSTNRDPFYLNLTANFINSDWALTAPFLKTQYYPDSHSAENVSRFIQYGLHEYTLTLGNVASARTDKVANMVADIWLTSLFHLQRKLIWHFKLKKYIDQFLFI